FRDALGLGDSKVLALLVRAGQKRTWVDYPCDVQVQQCEWIRSLTFGVGRVVAMLAARIAPVRVACLRSEIVPLNRAGLQPARGFRYRWQRLLCIFCTEIRGGGVF